MTTLMVPALEEEPWPSLGGQVCDFIEANLVFGPGDLRGQRAVLTPEKRALIWRMYEVYPKGLANAGRRRFRRVGLSLRKGWAKTECAAWIAAVELHPDGPVRCDGFDASGQPVGRGITDPYIPLVACTEEQTEDLAYHALYTILSLSPIAGDFDIGLERIMRKDGGGKAVALASSPDARDGARTSFQIKEETHRWVLPRLKAAARTMTANLAKRMAAEPWELETTTAFTPGEGSVAEATFEYAQAVLEGKRLDSRLFFFHRQASDAHNIATPEGIRAAVIEATGPDNVGWSDIEAICELAADPTMDMAYWERVWLNRPTQSSLQAFDVERWRELAKAGEVVADREVITLGFDGSRYNDATALIGERIRDAHQFVVGIWERPATLGAGRTVEEWEVPEAEVHAAVDEAFRRWRVWRMYADPFYWQSQVAAWAGKYGEKVVVSYNTTHLKQMHWALVSYSNAVTAGEISHDGNAQLEEHLGNARRRFSQTLDQDGQRMWVIQKERKDSIKKIDAAMAAVLAHAARTHAIAAGVRKESVYKTRGFRVLGAPREEVEAKE